MEIDKLSVLLNGIRLIIRHNMKQFHSSYHDFGGGILAREKISIYTIAKEAGVSPATVSRVVTNNARVSDEKKKKVQEIIDKYDFQPNALARGLSNTKSGIIGLLVADIRNPFYATMAVECEKAAYERDYMLLLCNTFKENEMKNLKKMFDHRVDAVILIGGKVDDVISDVEYVDYVNHIADSIPILITGKLDGADCFQVNIDEGQSMEILMEYLVENGHKNIALIGGRKDVKSTYDKRLRYRQLLRRHGLPFSEDYIMDSSYNVEGGYEAMNRFFEEKRPLPTAIIAINDFTAVGIMQAIKERGLKIPEDISITSFDNTYIAQSSVPNLTSVGYDYQQFGITLVDSAVKIIQNMEVPRVQFIKSELVIRDSCKKIN